MTLGHSTWSVPWNGWLNFNMKSGNRPRMIRAGELPFNLKIAPAKSRIRKSLECPFVDLPLVLQIIHHPLGCLTTRDHGGGHAGSGTCAGAREVQVAIMRVLEVGAKISQLHQVVAQPMRGTLHQVVAFAP